MMLVRKVVIHVTIIAALLPHLSLEENKGIVKDDREIECGDSNTCPTWFICNSQNKCQCGDGQSKKIIVCDDRTSTSAVLDCHCVTYDNETGSTFAGKCFYNCENHHSQGNYDRVYYTLPKKPQLLLKFNVSICSSFHRTGLLCGDCEEEYSPFVLSYNLSCVKCPDGHKNWWKFILVAFVPLTVFYFFIVLFNVNVTSSRLHGVVWFSQVLSTPAMVRLVMFVFSQGHPILFRAVKTVIVF